MDFTSRHQILNFLIRKEQVHVIYKIMISLLMEHNFYNYFKHPRTHSLIWECWPGREGSESVQSLRDTVAGWSLLCAILGRISHFWDIRSNESNRLEYAFIHKFSFPPHKNIRELIIQVPQPNRVQGMLGRSNHFRFRRSNISMVSRE